jgi:hypothetical protein
VNKKFQKKSEKAGAGTYSLVSLFNFHFYQLVKQKLKPQVYQGFQEVVELTTFTNHINHIKVKDKTNNYEFERTENNFRFFGMGKDAVASIKVGT